MTPMPDRVEHDYLALYPSGHRLTLRGVFVTPMLDGHVHIGVISGERLWLLDPRSVILRDGLVIRDPRSPPPTFPGMREWLAQHPEWSRVATEMLR